MREKRSLRVLAAAGFVTTGIALTPAGAIDLVRVWDNGGPANNWTDTLNWAPDTVGGPMNISGVDFFVQIPAGFNVNYDKAGDSDITGLDLGNNAVLSLATPGANLTVLDQAMLTGRLVGQGGDLVISSDNDTTATYNSSGMGFNAAIISADAGSNFDLSALTDITAGFNDGSGNSTSIHTITATNASVLDLSGLTSLSAPVRAEDIVRIALSDADSEIVLSSLETISGGSRSEFLMSGGSQLSLPALQTADDVHFTLSGGATLNADGVTPIAYSSSGIPFSATIMLADGLDTELDLSAVQSIAAGFNDGSGNRTSVHSITAVNGGVVNLSGLTTLSAPVRAEDLVQIALSDADSEILLTSLETISGGSRAQINLSGGSQLSLPALETADDVHLIATGGSQLHANGLNPVAYTSSGIPFSATIMLADGEDSQLNLTAITSIAAGFDDGSGNRSSTHAITAVNGGQIDLSGLTTLSAPVRPEDLVQIALSDPDSEILLSSLETISGGSRAQFHLSGGAQLSLPALETVQDTHFTLLSGAQLDANGLSPIAYSSSGIPFSATIMLADGNETRLNLPAITSIAAGFDDGSGNRVSVHAITAVNEGQIDLSGVGVLSGPVRGEDRVEIIVDTGGEISLGDLNLRAANAALRVDGGSTLNMQGLRASGPGRAIISLNRNLADDSGDLLNIDGSVELGTRITLLASVGSELEIAGDFRHSFSSPDLVQLGEVRVTVDSGDKQTLEVGGTDVGIAAIPFLPDRNFGIGQLVIAANTMLSPADARNNIVGGDPEALYLWGLDDDSEDGLIIETGGVLDLGYARVSGLTVYAFIDADINGVTDGTREWQLLTDWFGIAGTDEIAFGAGSIMTRLPGDFTGDDLVDVADLGILGANFGLTGRNWMQGDATGDGLVDVADLGILAANWDPQLDLTFEQALALAGLSGAVPEPATLSLLAVGAAGLTVRRRRR